MSADYAVFHSSEMDDPRLLPAEGFYIGEFVGDGTAVQEATGPYVTHEAAVDGMSAGHWITMADALPEGLSRTLLYNMPGAKSLTPTPKPKRGARMTKNTFEPVLNAMTSDEARLTISGAIGRFETLARGEIRTVALQYEPDHRSGGYSRAQYLITLARSNSAAWSGGPSNPTNICEGIRRSICLELLHDRAFMAEPSTREAETD